MLGEAMRRLHELTTGGIDYILLFVLFFALFSYLQFVPVIGDPDGFYHAKIARFLSEGRVLTELPWMQFSTLKDHFTDHHFLYHILLIPFVAFGKPLLGVKLATVFFGSIFFAVFYWAQKKLKCNAPALFTLLLFLATGFVFRLSLVKANSVSLILLFLILITLFEGRWKRLFFLNFAYVWLYGGWLLSWVAAGIFTVSAFLYRRYKGTPGHETLSDRGHAPTRLWKLNAATIMGSLAGLVINPYWPGNLKFYWQQVWQIGIAAYGNTIGAGGEWRSLTLPDFASNHLYALAFFFIGLVIVLMHAQRVQLRSWVSLVMSVLFIFFALKSRRYIELSAPLMVFFASCAWSDVFPRGIMKQIWRSWHVPAEWIRDQFQVSLFIALVIALTLPQIGLVSQIRAIRDDLSRGIGLHRYERVSRWLEGHTAAGSTVVHSDWDDWPMLFYFNDRNTYVIGLDPTFMYTYDRHLYDRWASLTGAGRSSNLVSLITRDLRSEYVLIEKDHTAMQQLVSSNIYFRLVYEDDEVWVYRFDGSVKG